MVKGPSLQILLKRSFKLALSNIWRNKVLSLATVFVIATILFIFNIILAVNVIAKDALNELNKKIDVTVYLKESTEFEQIEYLANQLMTVEGVEDVNYTSKKDALKQLKTTHPDISVAFEKYGLGNPLPASLNVTTTHPKYHKDVTDFLNRDEFRIYLSNVITNDNQENNNIISSVSKNLLELTNFTHQVIFWLILTFVLGGALIILNALQITMFSRKKELTVMKLVGASHWFIRAPFLIESIIYAILSILLSIIMLLVLTKNIQIEQTSLWQYYSGINFYTVFLTELAAAATISILSSFIAIHEHLQKNIA